jgi:UDPglucose 6-dehydrogenase
MTTMKSESTKSSSTIKTISMLGLGKLGVPFAAALANKGYNVIGVDTDPNKIRLINEGKAPVYEPGLQDMISANRERLVATNDYDHAVTNSDITFIVVPTPSDDQGGFSLRYVQPACETVGRILRQKSDFHLVILTSTVLPGATGGEIKPLLERCSGKQGGVEFGLCYSPEFIALGSVIRDFLNPDFILIGESDPHSGELLSGFYKKVCENNPPIARMNFENSELTKIALNSFVTMKITFANMLARISEKLTGADVNIITEALGLDNRIGPKYLKGAIGYGGPCFPRDNKAFTYFAKHVGASSMLAETTDAMNQQQVLELVAIVKRNLPKSGKVAILGLAYKPNTDVVEEAQGLELARLLTEEGVSVTAYDPEAMRNAAKAVGNSVSLATSLEACVRGADVIVITTPWTEFKNIEPAWLVKKSRRPALVDCWRILDPHKYQEIANYLPMGIGP